MVSSNSVLLTAGLAAVASAAPTASLAGHRKAGGFTAPQVRANGYVKHGPSAMAKALLKFGKTVPDDLAATIQAFKTSRRSMKLKRSNGSVVTTPEQYDTEYLTEVSIGTPAQTLNLDFDSGSSDLWVFSSETTSADVSGQSIYTPSDSSTSALVSGATWDITYGDSSSSSGTVYTDVVTVGGVSASSQAVEAAEQVSSSFTSDADSDGLLGLAFSSINTVSPTAQNTFFDNVKSDLDSPLWTVDLKHSEPGTYNFGWIDDTLYTGSIAYTDVDSTEGYWTFTADSYSVGTSTGSGSTVTTTTAPAATASSAGPGSGGSGSGSGGSESGSGSGPGTGSSGKDAGFGGVSRRQSSSTTLTGIADTGTTLALLPSSVCEEYYAQVSGASYSSTEGGYVFSCDATLVDFSYTVGDVTITIPTDYLNYSPVDTAGTQCYGGIQPDTDIGFSIFGDVALKAAFVVFQNDGSTPQLGFATKDL